MPLKLYHLAYSAPAWLYQRLQDRLFSVRTLHRYRIRSADAFSPTVALMGRLSACRSGLPFADLPLPPCFHGHIFRVFSMQRGECDMSQSVVGSLCE